VPGDEELSPQSIVAVKSLNGAAGSPSVRFATVPANDCKETDGVAQLRLSGASATGTRNGNVVFSPVGSVTTTCPVCGTPPRKFSANVWLTVLPVAVPPSSNVHLMSRLASPQGLRVPPGPVPLTLSWIGLPSVQLK